MTDTKTYFGLEIVAGKMVKLDDIKALPFADFFMDSHKGSTLAMNADTGEEYVYLTDWERFSNLFIKTGKHRYQTK